MRWSGTVDGRDIEILPSVPLRVTARRRVRYRVKPEFWGWLLVLFAWAYLGYQWVRARGLF